MSNGTIHDTHPAVAATSAGVPSARTAGSSKRKRKVTKLKVRPGPDYLADSRAVLSCRTCDNAHGHLPGDG